MAAWLCIVLGLAVGAYVARGFAKGAFIFKGRVKRSDGPFIWWSAVVMAATWSVLTAGAGIYMILR